MNGLKLKDLYDGFRDPATIRSLAERIGEEAAKVPALLKSTTTIATIY